MEQYVEECLQSILAQTYPAENFEIICVDDGSQDRSAYIARKILSGAAYTTYVRTTNQGLEKALNHALRLAKHEWIVRVDADDILDAGLLKALAEAIQNKPGFDFYYCQKFEEYFSADERETRTLPDFDTAEIFERGDFFATGTAYRKGDLQSIGGYPDQVKNCGLENYTVTLELISRNKKGFAVKNAFFSYRRHHANMSVVKLKSIIEFGHSLLKKYGRTFKTNENHPYRLKLDSIPVSK